MPFVITQIHPDHPSDTATHPVVTPKGNHVDMLRDDDGKVHSLVIVLHGDRAMNDFAALVRRSVNSNLEGVAVPTQWQFLLNQTLKNHHETND